MLRSAMLLNACCRLAAVQPKKVSTFGLSSHSLRPKPNLPIFRSTSSTPHQSLQHSAVQQWKLRAHRALRLFLISFGVVVTAHAFFEHVYSCSSAAGISMLPTLNSFGDWLVISKAYRRGKGIVVGDVVSAKHPVMPYEHAVKRVIGMEGDLVIEGMPDNPNGRMIQVPPGHCWLVGDNLQHSRDSRMYGPLPLALITGKIVARIETGQGLSGLKWSRVTNGLSVPE